MKIAVAYNNGEIHGHFGHCGMFAVYEYGEYVSDCRKTLVETGDRSGHQAMADLMKELDVAAVIVGNMGPEAKAALLAYGIVPVVGYSGDADRGRLLLRLRRRSRRGRLFLRLRRRIRRRGRGQLVIRH